MEIIKTRVLSYPLVKEITSENLASILGGFRESHSSWLPFNRMSEKRIRVSDAQSC